MSDIETIACTFFETMYPGQKWGDLAPSGSARAVMMRAAEKALAAIRPTADLFGALVVVDDWPGDYRERFWTRYPHKIGKATAMRALEVVHGSPKRPRWQALVTALDRYVHKTDDRPWCNPATWVRGHRWLDEPAQMAHNGANGFAAMARESVGL